MEKSLQLVATRQLNDITFECYQEQGQENQQDFWATREQIGQALGYENPSNAIKDIHSRHSERMDMFSTQRKMRQVEGSRMVTREVFLYNFKGLLEICRYSQQPVADAVMDVLWDIADEIRKTGSYNTKHEQLAMSAGLMEGARVVLEAAKIKDNQLTIALDNLYRSYTGHSVLKEGGIELEAPTKHQLLTPTDIGKEFGMSAQRVNQILAGAGWQHKIAGKWEPLELGEPYAVMQDTGIRHDDGAPVRQLKWDSSILEPFEVLLVEAG